MIAGIGNSAELHGVAFDILVGAGGGKGGTQGGVVDSEGNRQRVGHIGTRIHPHVINKQGKLIGAVEVTESHIDILAGVGREVEHLNFFIGARESPLVHQGEGRGVGGGGGDIDPVVLGIPCVVAGAHGPLHGEAVAPLGLRTPRLNLVALPRLIFTTH